MGTIADSLTRKRGILIVNANNQRLVFVLRRHFIGETQSIAAYRAGVLLRHQLVQAGAAEK